MKTTHVVKEFKFEAAHYLPNYEGACKRNKYENCTCVSKE